MPNYVARVRDSKGNARREKIIADSLGEARSALRERGLFVQELKQDEGMSLTKNLDLKSLQTSLASVTGRTKRSFLVSSQHWSMQVWL
jgi:type IV pilus assembly protein PilC